MNSSDMETRPVPLAKMHSSIQSNIIKKKKMYRSELTVKAAEYTRGEDEKIQQVKAFHGRGLSSYIDTEEIKSKEKLPVRSQLYTA